MPRPIQETMETTLREIRNMVDVDTVIGKPMIIDETHTVIPFSKVSFGFLSGGGELNDGVLRKAKENPSDNMNFIGGGASGVSIKPMGFIVSEPGGIKLISSDFDSPLDHIISSIPELIDKIKNIVKKQS